MEVNGFEHLQTGSSSESVASFGIKGPSHWELPLFLDPAPEVPLSAEIREAIGTFIHTELEQRYIAYQDCGAEIASVK